MMVVVMMVVVVVMMMMMMMMCSVDYSVHGEQICQYYYYYCYSSKYNHGGTNLQWLPPPLFIYSCYFFVSLGTATSRSFPSRAMNFSHSVESCFSGSCWKLVLMSMAILA